MRKMLTPLTESKNATAVKEIGGEYRVVIVVKFSEATRRELREALFEMKLELRMIR